MSDQPRVLGGWRIRGCTPSIGQAIVFLFILAFLLAGASFWLSVRTVQGQIASRASVVQLCQAGNESRAQQVTLWTHLVQLNTPPPHETAAQRPEAGRAHPGVPRLRAAGIRAARLHQRMREARPA